MPRRNVQPSGQDADPPSALKHSDIVDILLKSFPARRLKGVRLEINSEYFGTTWAASENCDTPRYIGVVDKWKTKNAVLMVKWDGWAQNRQTPLD